MDYRFAALLGAPYRGGNLLIHDNELLTPVGNRVTQVGCSAALLPPPPPLAAACRCARHRMSACSASLPAQQPATYSVIAVHRDQQINLTESCSSALPFENGRQIRTIAVSPDGRLLLSIDEEGRALVVNRRRRALLHHFSFKGPVRAAKWSPDGRYLAAAVGRLLQVRAWLRAAGVLLVWACCCQGAKVQQQLVLSRLLPGAPSKQDAAMSCCAALLCPTRWTAGVEVSRPGEERGPHGAAPHLWPVPLRHHNRGLERRLAVAGERCCRRCRRLGPTLPWVLGRGCRGGEGNLPALHCGMASVLCRPCGSSRLEGEPHHTWHVSHCSN